MESEHDKLVLDYYTANYRRKANSPISMLARATERFAPEENVPKEFGKTCLTVEQGELFIVLGELNGYWSTCEQINGNNLTISTNKGLVPNSFYQLCRPMRDKQGNIVLYVYFF